MYYLILHDIMLYWIVLQQSRDGGLHAVHEPLGANCDEEGHQQQQPCRSNSGREGKNAIRKQHIIL